ncbi:MAG: hypothetical protein WD830_00255 [Chloroflexota bacterium]
MTTNATVIYVAYNTTAIDLRWVPHEASVVIVHNDEKLDPNTCQHPNVIHTGTGVNIGFGAGVNVGLAAVEAERTIVCNPDTQLERVHWEALVPGAESQIQTLALHDELGADTAIVNLYPTPRSLVATAYRLGRWLPRGSQRRARLLRLLGSWGEAHVSHTGVREGVWPLSSWWASGAVFSVSTTRLREVGGFDERYFLYLEDVELCRRLSARFPDMTVVMAGVASGLHAVGGSTQSRDRRAVNRHYVASAQLYARSGRGPAWACARFALLPRMWWLSR